MKITSNEPNDSQMKDTGKKSESKEPVCLVRGKEFEEKIKKKWPPSNEPNFRKTITKPSGRKGRIDIFVDVRDKDDEKLVAVVEIKASDWDLMTLPAVRRNVRRQASQIWDYINSQIEDGKHISPGVIFKKMPKDLERLKLIEKLFDEQCIAVSWEDESKEERKVRS